ncbi:Adenylosuccinate synthetase [Desulfamplus magnetovallimortis]|uniref:Adenylosuccinate synthetase n=1 Tax=Desulfamplus magnetovallimortis TaxID=1246637 RepID=A0A1W1H967_9BACT|nr:adenylosuccinate synthetase [Desulfamplus magnetovallimortis]SLM28908.1 Adenylosuccinate synthetase [Desulfamplus magnetovallimortis]
MSHKVVIGANFGDEGKGLFTDYLCRKSSNPLVIRFSGGQQAGHTVVASGIRHTFSNFGAGTLQGAPCYYSHFCTIDPVGIVNELESLLKKGVEPKLYIDERSPVTTPYDIKYNQNNHPHGSCGVGVGDTIRRQLDHYSLVFGDLFYPFVFKTRLDLIKKYYDGYTDVDIEDFLECCSIITSSSLIEKSYGMPEGEYSDYIYEGSQGLLLDQDFGFFPHVTRASTGTKNAAEIAGSNNLEIFLVTRAYQTRHGKGPMSNEHLPHNIRKNPVETNVANAFQGKFRRTLLDLSLIEYAMKRDEIIRTTKDQNLVITCLDHMIDEYRFVWQGEIVHCDDESDFVRKIGYILGFDTVYVSSSDDALNITAMVGQSVTTKHESRYI